MHCAMCNLSLNEADGYRRDLVLYCCEGCANHTHCTCNREDTGTGLFKLF